jgi:hypothetical protein
LVAAKSRAGLKLLTENTLPSPEDYRPLIEKQIYRIHHTTGLNGLCTSNPLMIAADYIRL